MRPATTEGDGGVGGVGVRGGGGPSAHTLALRKDTFSAARAHAEVEARAGEQMRSLMCMKVVTAMWAELAAPGAKAMLAGEHMPDAESAAFWES